jgi:hypothetical protein
MRDSATIGAYFLYITLRLWKKKDQIESDMVLSDEAITVVWIQVEYGSIRVK